MDSIASLRIRLILDDALIRANKSIADKEELLLANHAARGLLKSGATIKLAARIIEEETLSLLVYCVEKITPFERSRAALVMIEGEVRSCLTYAKGRFQRVVNIHAGVATVDGGSRWTAAMALFETLQERVMRQVEIRGFDFLNQSPRPTEGTEGESRLEPIRKNLTNRGGKPMARHWDSLWSSIAARLYVGDLKPKTQADIERAMADWSAEQDVEIGATAIRERARELWKKIEND